jgi:hypothetical protein
MKNVCPVCLLQEVTFVSKKHCECGLKSSIILDYESEVITIWEKLCISCNAESCEVKHIHMQSPCHHNISS